MQVRAGEGLGVGPSIHRSRTRRWIEFHRPRVAVQGSSGAHRGHTRVWNLTVRDRLAGLRKACEHALRSVRSLQLQGSTRTRGCR